MPTGESVDAFDALFHAHDDPLISVDPHPPGLDWRQWRSERKAIEACAASAPIELSRVRREMLARRERKAVRRAAKMENGQADMTEECREYALRAARKATMKGLDPSADGAALAAAGVSFCYPRVDFARRAKSGGTFRRTPSSF